MAESTAFSSSGEDAISRVIAVEPDGPSDLSEQDLFDYFEIQRTVDEINKGDYKRVSSTWLDLLCLYCDVLKFHRVLDSFAVSRRTVARVCANIPIAQV